MYGNIANGGLAVKWRGTVVFAKPNEWFLNADDRFIYYSDRSDKNRLYRKRGEDDPGELIVKEPCAFVTLFEDGIYYANEEQMKVFRCSKEGNDRTLCSCERTVEFGISDDGFVYINPHASRLCVHGQRAYYADGNNNFALTIVDIVNSGTLKVLPDVKPSFINTHDANVYYTDRMRGNSLWRLDPSGGKLSIFGGSAECIHIIDNRLYFLSGNKWRGLSLLNFGESEAM